MSKGKFERQPSPPEPPEEKFPRLLKESVPDNQNPEEESKPETKPEPAFTVQALRERFTAAYQAATSPNKERYNQVYGLDDAAFMDYMIASSIDPRSTESILRKHYPAMWQQTEYPGEDYDPGLTKLT